MDTPTSPLPTPDDRSQQPRKFTLLTWLFWIIVTVLVPGGFGYWAWSNLMGLTNSADCQTAASAPESGTRLYCAETLAGDQNPEDLQQAISLASTISENDPLYPTAARLIGQWSNQLLQIAENKFQEGDLERALSLVEVIPSDAAVRKTADEQIKRWKTIWSKAEEIYREVEFELEQPDSDLEKWGRATAKARQLWTVGNHFWATVRYQELAEQIWRPEDKNSKKVAKSPSKPRISTVEDLIARRNQERQQENRNYLAKARSLANTGSLNDLRDAISEANQIFSDGPEYAEAQRLIQVWKRQVEVLEDQAYLDRAISLASKGDAVSLQAAIDEARWITMDRPLYQAAGERIDQWNTQLIQLQNSAYPPRQPSLPSPAPREPYPVEPVANPGHSINNQPPVP